MEENQYLPTGGKDINWLDYLPVLWKYRILIGALFLTSLLYGMVSTLLSPRVYEATAIIIKANGAVQGLNLLSLLAQQVGVNRGGSSQGGDNTLIVLRSRSMAEELAKQLNLQQYYGTSRLEDAVSTVRGATKILPSRDGPIQITVEDKDSQKAAEIANSYAGVLNRFLTRMGAGVSTGQRRFVEDRLRETEVVLRKAEENLKDFQEKNRTVVLPTQATEAITAAATLRAQLVAQEIQLQQVRRFATESNPEVITLKRIIGELKRQIGQAQYGSGMDLPPAGQNRGGSQKEIYLPAAKVPETVLAFSRLARDVKVQEALYTLLLQQLEQAKISELQDIPSVEILDPALPPGQPKPINIGQKMVIYGFIGMSVGIMLALVFDYLCHNWLAIKSRVFNMVSQ